MTTPNTSNGKPTATRKQLSDQLDRLDGIIDALAVGLNQAVADACREGARAAVREVILELISNPDLMAAVRAGAATPTVIDVTTGEPNDEPTRGAAPQPPAEPSFWSRVRETAKSAVNTVTCSARTLVRVVQRTARSAAEALPEAGTTKALIAVALGVGFCVSAVTLVCPSWMAAAVTGVTGAAAVVASYVGARVNSLFTSLRCT